MPVAPSAPSAPSLGDRISETASSAGKTLGEAGQRPDSETVSIGMHCRHL